MKFHRMLCITLYLLPARCSKIKNLAMLRSRDTLATLNSLAKRTDALEGVLERRGKKKSKDRGASQGASTSRGEPTSKGGAAARGSQAVNAQSVSGPQAGQASGQAAGTLDAQSLDSPGARASGQPAGAVGAQSAQQVPDIAESSNPLQPGAGQSPRRRPNSQTGPPNELFVNRVNHSVTGVRRIERAVRRGQGRLSYPPDKQEADAQLRKDMKSKLRDATLARHEANAARRQRGPLAPETAKAMQNFVGKSDLVEEAITKVAHASGNSMDSSEGLTHVQPTPSGMAAVARAEARVNVRAFHKAAMNNQWRADQDKARYDHHQLVADTGRASLEAGKDNPSSAIGPKAVREQRQNDQRAETSLKQWNIAQNRADRDLASYQETQRELHYTLQRLPNDSSSDESEKSVKVR